MFNPRIIRWFWVTAPAIAWATLFSTSSAIATELKSATEPQSAALQNFSEQTVQPLSQPSINVEALRFTSSDIAAQSSDRGSPVKLPDERSPSSAGSLLNSTAAEPSNGMAQVTSVSQLSDVRPTDWAFQALQSLVERYGCIAGYPGREALPSAERTYRGNRALTRYEFAAGLNACLDRVNELIAASTNDLVRKEDLTTLQKLQDQFAAELATLRGRLDTLEARTTTLEKQQFSTTTVLRGLAVFNLSGAFFRDTVTAERNPFVPNVPFAASIRQGGVPSRVQREQPKIVSNYLVYLNLNTSFTGRDQLVTQLAAGNGSSPANQIVSSGFFNTSGTPFLETTPAPNGAAGAVVIRELFYSFPASENVRVFVGPRINFYRHFDNNRFTFFLTGATSFNSNGSTLSNAVDRGSGAVVAWNINPQLRLSVGYLGLSNEFLANNSAEDPALGLFGGTNTLATELVYSPTRNFNLRLLYTRSNLQATNGLLSGEPVPYGFIDDGFGGAVNNGTANTFIANFDWLITPRFGIFGRYGYGITNIDPINPIRANGNLNTQTIQFGLAFPDLGKRGALGVFSFLVPHDYLSGRRFLRSGGGDGATQYEFELSYYYPLTNNIAIVPAVYAIVNANSFSSNPTVFVGNLRTQFSF
ncbi:iron uptake porin [Leptolyngbya sp. AN03gr2]|uniref:iron uptake porin n=1 Tax=unclassified Leptolyngbya TaxID=2650499 RepID=UPI003D311FB1